MISIDKLSDVAVRAVVTAINAGDREGFFAVLAPDATLADDGTERDLTQWVDREVFTSNGYMEVVSESAGGRSLIANYRNDTWGEMRTKWVFTVTNGAVNRIETGQA